MCLSRALAVPPCHDACFFRCGVRCRCLGQLPLGQPLRCETHTHTTSQTQARAGSSITSPSIRLPCLLTCPGTCCLVLCCGNAAAYRTLRTPCRCRWAWRTSPSRWPACCWPGPCSRGTRRPSTTGTTARSTPSTSPTGPSPRVASLRARYDKEDEGAAATPTIGGGLAGCGADLATTVGGLARVFLLGSSGDRADLGAAAVGPGPGLRAGRVGGPRDAHHPGPGCLRVAHLLHLLGAAPQGPSVLAGLLEGAETGRQPARSGGRAHGGVPPSMV